VDQVRFRSVSDEQQLVGAARERAPPRPTLALPSGEEALVMREPLRAEPCMATPPASDNPGVLARPAHDVPGADGGPRGGASGVDPLAPLSNREAPQLSAECPEALVDLHPLPVTHHNAIGRPDIARGHTRLDASGQTRGTRVALERSGQQRGEHELTVWQALRRDRHP